MDRKAEQFLHADRKLRPFLSVVIYRHGGAGWGGKVGRRLSVEPRPQFPRHHRIQGCPKIVRADLRERGLPGKKWCEPFRRRAGQRIVRQTGPLVAYCPMQEHQPTAELKLGLAPWQPSYA